MIDWLIDRLSLSTQTCLDRDKRSINHSINQISDAMKYGCCYAINANNPLSQLFNLMRFYACNSRTAYAFYDKLILNVFNIIMCGSQFMTGIFSFGCCVFIQLKIRKLYLSHQSLILCNGVVIAWYNKLEWYNKLL